jgi:hypothetical protein
MRNVLFLLLLCCAFFALPAQASDCKAVRIPVFFVTDRNREDKGDDAHVVFGRERKYRGVCKHDPYMGVAYCVVKNIEHKCSSPLWNELGWQTYQDNRREGMTGIKLTEGADYAEQRTRFFEDFYALSQKMPSPHEVDVFVPGYMSTFESGLRSAFVLLLGASGAFVFMAFEGQIHRVLVG